MEQNHDSLFTELNTNQVINGRALEQAGIQTGDSFEITNFNYNVSAVTKLLKMHLENSYFDGESVLLAKSILYNMLL